MKHSDHHELVGLKRQAVVLHENKHLKKKQKGATTALVYVFFCFFVSFFSGCRFLVIVLILGLFQSPFLLF